MTTKQIEDSWKKVCNEPNPLLIRFRQAVNTSGMSVRKLTLKMLSCGFLTTTDGFSENDYMANMYYYLIGEFGFSDRQEEIVKAFILSVDL